VLGIKRLRKPIRGGGAIAKNVLSAGWLFSKLGTELVKLTLKPVLPLYCYGTIGGSDC
jgi:hypothetical protein